MKLSEKKRVALYAAISEPITQKRITVAQSEDVLGSKNAKDLDEMLSRLERQIWREVHAVLNLEGPAYEEN